ncbi:hypothetical protein C1752_02261 [Acaryochloris thomasi RCC1774]|uniref:Uncharacterized protein n=1 Tax=Acaryochloris thomasi RCC1774 TaxID=1764569 RepID=A0A2W1JUA4_9CYAN|nr:hypothetical protein [Acaryochloris thomasi]PZD73374.1 hypothetical protein C1752_02261 [Acaryochloris thomasi RCC1774]
MQPNNIQLQRLFEILQYRLPQQWKARFIDVLPGGELVVIFEQGTNPEWRYWYTIYSDGEFLERQFYV